ncbi:hypothetical protein SASPL_141590 [Salvia splendens]|uniref:Tryptophan N-monooxygenase n=1 Tax=Salvia splendens TaxID=180675 RepID=A0A8X8WS83_SALSN|nr:hypothetical protein SASPL_141590 [Salvia splendens]
MLSNKPAFRWIHNLMQDLNTEISCIKLGTVHVIAVTSPELSREFLKKQDAVFDSQPDAISARITSDGYLTLALSPSGDQWAKMRRVMRSGVLSNAVFQRLHEKRREEADHLVRYVYKQCKNPDSNGSVNVRDAARHYCGNMIRKMVFGERFFGSGMADGGAGVEEREHVDGLFAILSCLYGFAIADFLPWLEVLDLDGHKKKITNAIKNVRRYQDPEIEKRIEMWEKGLKIEWALAEIDILAKASKNWIECVPHVSSKDTVVCGYFIPKGSQVLLSRPGLGRNPRVWDEPLRFRPERHVHDEDSVVVLTDPELHMLSFSTGRRGCPGVVLGSTLSTMLLARLIQCFAWKPPLSTNTIDLAKSENDLALAKPLIAHALPRLNSQIYL